MIYHQYVNIPLCYKSKLLLHSGKNIRHLHFFPELVTTATGWPFIKPSFIYICVLLHLQDMPIYLLGKCIPKNHIATEATNLLRMTSNKLIIGNYRKYHASYGHATDLLSHSDMNKSTRALRVISFLCNNSLINCICPKR